MVKRILFDKEARQAIMKGIDRVADAVKVTLGSRGRAGIIGKSERYPNDSYIVTRDGVTVAQEDRDLGNGFENIGAAVPKKVAIATNKEVGDATTSAVVLTQALAREGFSKLDAGFDGIDIRNGMLKATKIVVSTLKEISKEVKDKEEVKRIATVSSKDAEMGSLIADVIDGVGKDGIITIEESQGASLSSEIVEGLQIDKGFISPHMMTNTGKLESVLNNPYILVTDKKISAVQEIVPILEKLMASGKKEIVIIADDVDGEALTTLVVNKRIGMFTALAIKAPGFGENKKELLKDIATVTGAEFISQELGHKLEEVQLASLGNARKVVANKDKTIIIDGAGSKEKIQERISQIQTQLSLAETDFEKEKLKARLGKLSGGVAVIKVGGVAETEQKEKQQRVEDAVNAAKSSLAEGVVPGGGVALVRAYQKLQSFINTMDINNMDEIMGAKVILTSIKAPIKQLAENAGVNGDVVLNEVLKNENDFGFNTDTREYGNLIEAGVIDATKAVRVSLENAVSEISMFVIADFVECDEPKETKQHETSL